MQAERKRRYSNPKTINKHLIAAIYIRGKARKYFDVLLP